MYIRINTRYKQVFIRVLKTRIKTNDICMDINYPFSSVSNLHA